MKKFLMLMTLFSISLFANCEDMYYQKYKPSVLQDRDTKEICYTEFDIAYNTYNSNRPLGAIFSAEHLTDYQLKVANKLKRVDNFHDEPSLQGSQKLFVNDYLHSNYDKGHLAPNKDFSTKETQYECFSMANMIPQTKENNRGIWSNIEGFTRHLVFTYKEGYVFTGPLYNETSKSFANNKTKIPSHVWKAVYLPSINSGFVIIATNDKKPKYETKSIQEFEQQIGYKLYKNSTEFKLLDMSQFRFDQNSKSYSSKEKDNNEVSDKLKKETYKLLKKMF